MRTNLLSRQGMRRKRGGRGALTIGVMGSSHGVGTTHTACMLADFLARETGEQTVLAECNSSGALTRLCNALEPGSFLQREYGREEPIRLTNKIALMPDLERSRIPVLLNEGYSNMVFDFGCEWDQLADELMRCNRKVILASLREWELDRTRQFLQVIEPTKGREEWLYLAVFGSDSSHTGFYMTQWEPRLFVCPEKMARLFETLL